MSALGQEIRQERLSALISAYTEASSRVSEAAAAQDKAGAAVARRMLLDIAADYPKIKAFWWNVSWEYDDEGAYYASANLYFRGIEYGDNDADNASYYEVEEALYDPASYLTPGAIEYLGPEEQEVTIAQLKAMSL